jgi:DNA-binding LacI/PurR family transcriptional regulator
MSLRRVAQLAGVSTSTVSRVVNDYPYVAADTALIVRRTMKQLSVAAVPRRPRSAAPGGRARLVAFLVIGASGSHAAPSFEKLIRGVSDALNHRDVGLVFSFVSDPGHLPPRILDRRINGVLLHGERPVGALEARLRRLPTVWLMANRERPAWGDQVMPDSAEIGELAARYLLRRGHRRVAYLGIDGASWSLGLRALSFAKAAADAGAEVRTLTAPEDRAAAAGADDYWRDDYWRGDGAAVAARGLVKQFVRLDPRPTGLFVAEDRLLPTVDLALAAHGLRTCRAGGGATDDGAAVDVVSCNNERPYLIGLAAPPATIDIRAEAIGRRGVDQLLWRMNNTAVPERIHALVEPLLVEPARAAGRDGAPDHVWSD